MIDRAKPCLHFYFAVSFLLAVLLNGCSSLKVAGRRREEPVPIDGKGFTWHDSLTILDDKTTYVGVLNDDEFLYVRLLTTNRALEGQIIRRGLTFWFDADGGDKKTFGIRFPLGLSPFGAFGRNRRTGSSDSFARRGDSILVPVNDLEILGPGEGDVHRMTFAEASGIDARFQTSHDTLTYTLKVPISSSGYFPFTIGTNAGSAIGVTLETAMVQPSRGSGEEGGEGGGRPGRGGFGGTGGYGGYGRRGFGENRSNRSAQEKPFSQFVKIQLADSTSRSLE